MDADGSNRRVLYDAEPNNPNAPPLAGNHPRWSPDGTKIAFDLCINCQISTNYAIYVFDLETNQLTRLTDEPPGYQSSHPTWSPDGSRIAFVSNRDYVGADTLRFRRDLYIMDEDGSNQTRLTETGFAREPVWNPNSNTITFRSSDPDTDLGLFRVNLQTGQVSRIEIKLAGNKQLFPQTWSADGSFLLATGRDQSRPQEYFIYIIDTVKKETKQLPFGPTEISGADWFVPIEN